MQIQLEIDAQAKKTRHTSFIHLFPKNVAQTNNWYNKILRETDRKAREIWRFIGQSINHLLPNNVGIQTADTTNLILSEPADSKAREH